MHASCRHCRLLRYAIAVYTQTGAHNNRCMQLSYRPIAKSQTLGTIDRLKVLSV